MAMHKTAKDRIKGTGRSTSFESFAHISEVAVFNVLDPDDIAAYNKLVNQSDIWVREKDITIHPMERKGSIYIVVFYQKLNANPVHAPKERSTPKELLEGFQDDSDEIVKNVDDDE